MSEKYYIKHGKRYKLVGYEPHFTTDGIYLVKQQGCSYQRVAKLTDLKENFPYALMAKDVPELASYIGAKSLEEISGSLIMYPDGHFQYSLPSHSDIAENILKFLAMSSDERKRTIEKARTANTHINSEGAVVDKYGDMVYSKYSKEAFAAKLTQLRKEVAEYERILEQRLIDEL